MLGKRNYSRLSKMLDPIVEHDSLIGIVSLPAIDQIDQLSHAELVALVKALIVEVQRLQIENQELKAEIEKLRKPPASSGNSSLPPSRDQKRNIKGKRRKKHGPRYGHQRAIRPLVDDPDQVIEATVQKCEHCQSGLEGVPPTKILRHQITEIPPIKPVVIETRQHEVICPECQGVNRGVLPEELNRRGSFGQLERGGGLSKAGAAYKLRASAASIGRSLWGKHQRGRAGRIAAGSRSGGSGGGRRD